jgi:hypothetical protein
VAPLDANANLAGVLLDNDSNLQFRKNHVIVNNTASGNGIPGVTMHSHAPGQNMNGNIIAGNTLSGNGLDFTQPGASTQPTGIEIFADPSAAPVLNTEILRNKFQNEKVDVWIGANNTSADVHFNDLVGAGVVGVQNAGSGVVHAQLNYWGCPTGPNTAGCSTTVPATATPSIETVPFLRGPV